MDLADGFLYAFRWFGGEKFGRWPKKGTPLGFLAKKGIYQLTYEV